MTTFEQLSQIGPPEGDPLATWVYDEMNQRGWGYRTLAAKVAERVRTGTCSYTTVNNWALGRMIPKDEHLVALASVFGVPVEDAIARSVESSKNQAVRRALRSIRRPRTRQPMFVRVSSGGTRRHTVAPAPAAA